MDLLFEIFEKLKWEYELSRVVSISLGAGIEIRIYSEDKLIVLEKDEDVNAQELAYLKAAKKLIQWVKLDEIHASRSARKETQWVDILKEQLGITDDEYNSEQ